MQFYEAAGPVLFAVIFSFVVYRRIRRSVGRQQVTAAVAVRIAIFGLVGLLLVALPSSSRVVQFVALAAGAALGLYGLSQTRFEHDEAGTFFTPNPYVGMTVVALFVGRLIYRMTTMRGRLADLPRNGPEPGGSGFSITITLLLAMIGYYLCYYVGVLLNKPSRATVGADAGGDPP